MSSAVVSGWLLYANSGRHPGVIQVTFLAPRQRLEAAGLWRFAAEQYGL